MTVKMRLFVGLCLCFSLFLSFQNIPVQEAYNKVIEHYKAYNKVGSDKVYVQTDKPYYTTGETIWIKAYVVDAIRHLKSPHSQIVYVELIDPADSIVATRRLMIEDVGAAGDIRLSPDWSSGNYTLRAYTNYMRNSAEQYFYRQSIPVWFQDIENKGKAVGGSSAELSNTAAAIEARPALQFYPEGGELVAGLKSKMGIKLTDQGGNGLSLEGSIVEDNGQPVAVFRTFDFGLGVVSFTPESGKKYRAEIKMDDVTQTYAIPEIKAHGYNLSIGNLGKSIEVKVQASTGENLEGAFLIGHLRGGIFLQQVFTTEHSEGFTYQLSTANLPDGVAQFTLYKADGEPICERLTFIDNPADELEVKLKVDRDQYKARQKVSMDIELKDKTGRPVIADLSLAITDLSAVTESSASENIKSWLLLNSDLRGEIKNPGFFFSEPFNGKRRYLLDALMLTHGWRKFVWTSLPEQPVAYPGEQGIVIKGATTKLGQPNSPVPTFTRLNVLESELFQNEQETDEQGRFTFGPYLFQDTVEVVLQARKLKKNAKKKKGKLTGDRFVDIQLSPEAAPPNIISYDFTRPQASSSLLDKYLSISQERKRNDRIFDGMSIDFDEITVTGRRTQRTEEEVIESIVSYYGEPTHRLMLDSMMGTDGNSVFDLLMRMPGVTVSGSYPNQTAQIRGSVSFQAGTAPLYLLDGNPIDESFAAAMRSNEVFLIDLLSGPEAAIYGSQASNGVIALYSRRGSRGSTVKKRQPGIINFTHPGLYKARQFFSPNYAKRIPDHQKPDLRTTLFWEPSIAVNGEGPAKLDFYTCDNAGTYLVKLEGISSMGQLIYQTSVIEVK
ncbi:MAG: TonB-dependent receptor plug domain-containing protein [Saprospiraceae bacterium]|nr:TonB-dependent receptor plug domain-containing protein [Saprospiraceae bacterium]